MKKLVSPLGLSKQISRDLQAAQAQLGPLDLRVLQAAKDLQDLQDLPDLVDLSGLLDLRDPLALRDQREACGTATLALLLVV